MNKTFNNDSQKKQARSLHAFGRIVASLICLLLILVIRLPEWDYGLYNDTKFWYFVCNYSTFAVPAFFSAVAILFLLPVIIRGSPKERITAAVLLLLPSVIAAFTWWIAIEELLENLSIILRH
jgi:hypothetical protein